MLVEYQPARPMSRDFSPGAMMVFMSVCPVLKSLPQTGTLFFLASSSMAGMSAERLGAPLA